MHKQIKFPLLLFFAGKGIEAYFQVGVDSFTPNNNGLIVSNNFTFRLIK